MLKKNLIINFLNSTPLPEADPPLADNPPDEIGKKGNWESSLSLKRGTEGELENNFAELIDLVINENNELISIFVTSINTAQENKKHYSPDKIISQ